MEKKDFDADRFLNEILRETENKKKASANTRPTTAPRERTAPTPQIKRVAPAPQPQASAPVEKPIVPPTVNTSETVTNEPKTSLFTAPATSAKEDPYAAIAALNRANDTPTKESPMEEPDDMDVAGLTSEYTAPIGSNIYSDLEGESHSNELVPGKESLPKRRKSWKQRHRVASALIMTILILGVSVLLSMILIFYGQDLLGINSNSEEKLVTIPSGANTSEVADILAENGIISKPKFFVFIAGLSNKDSSIKPGDHELRADMAYETILSELVSDPMDDDYSVDVVFPEGITLVDAADLLEENGVCDADEFIEYFNSNDAHSQGLTYEQYLPTFMDDKFYPMEGYLYPDTYTFYQDMDVALVTQKILENFNSKITQEDYNRMNALGLSLDETITLASMIQAEAGNVDEMTTISSVFWNRLHDPTEFPLLQSDPTTKYVEEVIKPHSTEVDEDLYFAYDTYQCDGLPLGPICNPGEDAIYAALNPANTGYYYFYANVDIGETYFAETLKEQEKNIEQVKKEQEKAAKRAEKEEKKNSTTSSEESNEETTTEENSSDEE